MTLPYYYLIYIVGTIHRAPTFLFCILFGLQLYNNIPAKILTFRFILSVEMVRVDNKKINRGQIRAIRGSVVMLFSRNSFPRLITN